MNHEQPDDVAERSLEVSRQAYEGIRAVLSDDHNYELGLFALKDVIDRVAEQRGGEGLVRAGVRVGAQLAKALERIAGNEGLAAVDLAEVWFAD